MPSPVVPGSVPSHGRVRAIPKHRDSIARERLGMVEQAPRPQRLWPGLVLLLSPVALIGGLSTSAQAQSCGGQISSSTAGATVTNNGCIETSGNLAAGDGISSSGANATITNTNSDPNTNVDYYPNVDNNANYYTNTDTNTFIKLLYFLKKQKN